MGLLPASIPIPPARRVPYAQASALQISRALVVVREETLAYYPGLDQESWAHALLTVQTDLWVTPHTAHLDQQGFKRMARCLFAYLQTDVVEHRVLGPCGPHFAQQLVDRQDDAIDGRAEIEAAPLADGPAVYGLVTGLAAGDIVALEVYQTTEPGTHKRPRSADLDRARAAVPGRLQVLHDARGEPTSDQRPRPWQSPGPVHPFFPFLPFPNACCIRPAPPFTLAARLLLTSGLLLVSCLSPSPTTPPTASAAGTATPASPAFSYGTHADSLNGIQGHTFGEPLRDFPGLVLLTKEDERGVRVYQMPPAKKCGWFGKPAQDFATYYQFQDGQFAMIRAVTTDLGTNRTAMREEARFLFGPGKDRNDQMSGLDWEGERVRVMYSEKLTSPVQYWLEV